MRLKITILLLLLIFAGCHDTEEILLPQPVNYLALGDSYTIGQGVEAEESWPIQLTERLRSEDYLMGKTEIIARTGWKTSDLLTALDAADTTGYNLVSLLIGVNNQFAGQPFAVFENEFDELLNAAIAIAGSTDNVFVLSIPDYGVTPFGNSNREIIAQELDQYNIYISQKCAEENIVFVNVTTISRDLGDLDGALAADNLHPSGDQYRQWMEATLPAVKEILR